MRVPIIRFSFAQRRSRANAFSRRCSSSLAAGVAVALLSTRALLSLLYQVDPIDLPTFAAVPLMLIAAAVAASRIPAWRASRVDPMEALRAE